MKAAQINPDFRSKIRFMPNFPIAKPWQIRALNKVMGFAPDPKINDLVTREIISFGNGSGVRVFTPIKAASEAALLYIHGGGMVIGSASQDHQRLADLDAELGIWANSDSWFVVLYCINHLLGCNIGRSGLPAAGVSISGNLHA